MSEQRRKLETLYEEWAQGDYSRSDIFDPGIEMETVGMAEPAHRKSYEEFVDFMPDWLSAWGRPLTIEAEEMIESGDRAPTSGPFAMAESSATGVQAARSR